jgi:hypothetical protein
MRRLTIRRRRARPAPRALIAAAAVLGGYALLVRPWHRRWGASRAETREPLPGDELPGRTTSTRAITIHAPASEAWRWLVQIGQDRGGFYSYTAIENGLFGAGIHNTTEVVPEWQERKRGDFIRGTRPDWMGGRYADKAGWRVADIEPGRYMVLEGWGTFLLRPLDDRSCRLIVRSHGPALPWWLAPLDALLLEPGHFMMERKMMREIKALAERSVAREGAVPAISA